jgi:hypothetical protein
MVNVFQYSSGCTTFEGWDDCDLSALVWLEALIEPSDGCWIVAIAARERRERVQQWLPPKRNEGLNDRAARTIPKKPLSGHGGRLDLCNRNYLLVSFYLHWV